MSSSVLSKVARPYNIVLWGATGFTGRLACMHVVQQADPSLRVALAGRDRNKLEALREELKRHAASQSQDLHHDFDLLVADSKDQASIDEFVGKAQVVMALAGPFMNYSKGVVDACVRLGTDYCDITGEPDYIQDLIEQYHDAAKERGVRVVNCCGYDSVPYDIGSFVVAEYMHSMGATCTGVQALNGQSKGGVSGGTIATALRCVDEPRPGMSDPCMLSPELRAQGGGDGGGASVGRSPQAGLAYSKECAAWSMPSIMAAINSKVVYRSAGLLRSRYSPRFTYNEAMLGPNFLASAMGVLAMGLGAALLYFRATRWILLSTVLPKPSQGPSEEMRTTGFFNVHFVGKGETSDGKEKKAVGKFAYLNGDPGYQATSLMLLESALALLQTQDQIKPGMGGVLTPATGLGWALVKRLRASNFEISVASMKESDNPVTAKLDRDWVPAEKM
mmetsp:Transcript_4575/g.8614  ORF Transcript_4575/g.8614 Transcript_4575/m.8614 type:complete len:448 (-) Transcript_4575:347-1690(-)|eukprot:CAMPEP_0114250570 /NCGR_PEP_ID=MMETSP0058-20121206/14773_1 /TAXON_ID=36894 /ORGANISM="Pyramimonas parkeae, CCMP726" /LENGTH=447 /DNA_ID=CAMNT_0001364245 /DNA_START=56 /DNA_END=1399 /DNA_ORIENTATION=-